MGVRIVLIAVLALLVAAPAAMAAPGPYRTDEQAARYLERVRGGWAYCVNGYYSHTEQRSGRHFPRRGGNRFRSFVCSTGGGDLYVRTRFGRWAVVRDR
jgi:hypothetical protein